jgi:hypothetical protein
MDCGFLGLGEILMKKVGFRRWKCMGSFVAKNDHQMTKVLVFEGGWVSTLLRFRRRTNEFQLVDLLVYFVFAAADESE